MTRSRNPTRLNHTTGTHDTIVALTKNVPSASSAHPYDGWHSNGYFHYGAFRQQAHHPIYNQSATYQTIH
jgi:hypothetical protein